jgi:hypothetical protein
VLSTTEPPPLAARPLLAAVVSVVAVRPVTTRLLPL